MTLTAKQAVDWAASRWQAEVARRPLGSVYRRALDDTWRQVIRHFGGDDVALCGPSHQGLVNAASASGDYSLTDPSTMGPIE